MKFFKLCNSVGGIAGAFAEDAPNYIKWQEKNRLLVRCKEREAEGLLADDGNTIYRYNGHTIGGIENEGLLNAVSITVSEYEEIIADLDPVDLEDVVPEIPNDLSEVEVMTRAQLTAKVNELQDQNDMLTECLLEMSELVYGGDL